VKTALEKLGLCSARMRLPMVPADEAQRDTVRAALEARGLAVVA
jgi:dihydrodipicolinate synthase/N-acetylneuraminate lyase